MLKLNMLKKIGIVTSQTLQPTFCWNCLKKKKIIINTICTMDICTYVVVYAAITGLALPVSHIAK